MHIILHSLFDTLRSLSLRRRPSLLAGKGAVVMSRRFSRPGFTIVELLIVIVVIAILAVIAVVAYNGMQDRARSAALRSDLTQVGRQLTLFQADKGAYPATVSTDCAATPDSATNKCLKLSSGNTISSYNSPSPAAVTA